MSAEKFPPTCSNKPEKETTSSMLADWQARHYQAIRHPQTLFEQAFVQMLQGWECYAHAHQTAYKGHILSDGVLGDCWTAIGEGLLGLLNGELNRLDGGTLDRQIRGALLEPVKEEEESEVIFAYSRAEAIADGVLVDVTATAKEAGFRIPVALTQALWADIHAIPERLQGVADTAGRLWDVLFLGHFAIKQQAPDSSSCLYRLEMPVGKARQYEVKAVCGPGDGGEPVITLMQPGED